MKSKPCAIFILALIAFGATPKAQAEFATLEEARAVGERWLEHRISLGEDWGPGASIRLQECREITRDGRLLGFLLPVAPAGHIIVSPLKELAAVKAFSSSSSFDATAPGYADLIQDTQEATLSYLEDHFGSLDDLPAGISPARNRDSWRWLLEGGQTPRDRATVGPLLHSNWHQSGPFWNDCPPGDGGQCLVGCVATAAAQIINHWRYPANGEGSFSYYWGGDGSCGGSTGGGTLSAYYGDGYDWANILDSYSSGYNGAQAAAVAELNYEVAVAYSMGFGHCASGTFLTPTTSMLKEHFRFADGVQMKNRNGFDAAGWWSLLKSELDAFPPRPMLYGIVSHAIVCDGYMEDGPRYYHMNYGWGGGSTAWYALDDVYCPWAGCDYMAESACVGIEPEAYFSVGSPQGDTVWTHGDPMTAVTWWGSSAQEVVIDLYRGRDFVARLCDWTADDGSELPPGAVDPAWGSGSQFRIKVTGDDLRFGWTVPFGIYGAGAWADASSAPINPSGQGRGAAWGDCDGDGRVDLYLANRLDGNHLYVNEGAGVFSDQSPPPLDDGGAGYAVAWADADNDGDLDLFLSRSDGQANSLFRNDGAGSFTDIASGPLAEASNNRGAAWGDYDNDGLVDLYLVRYFSGNRLLHNDGGGVFSDATVPPVNDAGGGRSAAWGDYDNDGDLDLYLAKYSYDEFYRNDGNGSFTELAGSLGIADSGNGLGACWGDYDNDGDLDLYVGNDGVSQLYRNDGAAFSNVTAGPLAHDGRTQGAAWGDYDNDGFLDLYLACSGENVLLHNEGNGQFVDATHPLLSDGGDSEGASWADFDGDGDLDLYVVEDGQPNRLFQNDCVNGNHWLQVDLEGTSSNRAGIGALLCLYAGDRVLTRQVGGDTSGGSQSSLCVEFGLGTAAIADSIVIRWPSGQVTRHFNLPADARHLLGEESTAVPGDADVPGAFALHANHPNPFNPKTSLGFSLPEASLVTLRVYDLSGRLVRTLLDGAQRWPAGTHELSWDGTDDASRPLPSGIYLCRFEAGGYRASMKLSLLK